jgi:hypothetical protein
VTDLKKECATHLRKKQLAQLVTDTIGKTPVQFLLETMVSAEFPMSQRIDAAKALLPYLHAKKPVEQPKETTTNELTIKILRE